MSEGTLDPSPQIDQLTNDLAEKLDAMSTSSFIREGILKHAMTSLVWVLFEKFPDERPGLIEAMENWPDLIRNAAFEERSADG